MADPSSYKEGDVKIIEPAWNVDNVFNTPEMCYYMISQFFSHFDWFLLMMYWKADFINTFVSSLWRQTNFMLPCVYSVTDHRKRQDVVRTSMAHSPCSSCTTFLVLTTFPTSSAICKWTDVHRQLGTLCVKCTIEPLLKNVLKVFYEHCQFQTVAFCEMQEPHHCCQCSCMFYAIKGVMRHFAK